jgi:hypothetical protein
LAIERRKENNRKQVVDRINLREKSRDLYSRNNSSNVLMNEDQSEEPSNHAQKRKSVQALVRQGPRLY